jgi:hypothetical protein
VIDASGSTLPTVIVPAIFDSGNRRVAMRFTTNALAHAATPALNQGFVDSGGDGNYNRQEEISS